MQPVRCTLSKLDQWQSFLDAANLSLPINSPVYWTALPQIKTFGGLTKTTPEVQTLGPVVGIPGSWLQGKVPVLWKHLCKLGRKPRTMSSRVTAIQLLWGMFAVFCARTETSGSTETDAQTTCWPLTLTLAVPIILSVYSPRANLTPLHYLPRWPWGWPVSRALLLLCAHWTYIHSR